VTSGSAPKKACPSAHSSSIIYMQGTPQGKQAICVSVISNGGSGGRMWSSFTRPPKSQGRDWWANRHSLVTAAKWGFAVLCPRIRNDSIHTQTGSFIPVVLAIMAMHIPVREREMCCMHHVLSCRAQLQLSPSGHIADIPSHSDCY